MITVNTPLSRHESFIESKHVVVAFTVSVVFHFFVFQIIPNMQGKYEKHIVVDAELIQPVALKDLPVPIEDKPIIKQASKPSKLSDEPKIAKTVKLNTGVALPVLAEKTESKDTSTDYVVRDTPALSEGEKLPFASSPGSLPLSQYTPSENTSTQPNIINSEADVDVDGDSLNLFGSQFREKIAKFKSYPAIASRRGWQGTVLVQVKFNKNGVATNISIDTSSGHKALDDRALEMVQLASKEINITKELINKKFTITVPVEFKLQS